MSLERRTRLSKLLSWVLRHRPEAIGARLDPAGWARVDDVLRGLRERGEVLGFAELELLVATSDKQRFELSPDGARLRARQGHSLPVALGLPPRIPPEILLHGTVERFLDSILARGIERRARQHVHLSEDEETALRVARRRAGTAILLRVRALAMHAEGYEFVRSDNGVWLTEHVPPPFLDGPPELREAPGMRAPRR